MRKNLRKIYFSSCSTLTPSLKYPYQIVSQLLCNGVPTPMLCCSSSVTRWLCIKKSPKERISALYHCVVGKILCSLHMLYDKTWKLFYGKTWKTKNGNSLMTKKGRLILKITAICIMGYCASVMKNEMC